MGSPSSDFDQDRLLALQVMVCSRMDEMLSSLELSFPKSNKMYFGCCPIHGGDNRNALNLYFSGDSVPGYWRCNSRHCEKVFRQTIIGFVRGVLSHQKYGWTGPTSKKSASFPEAVEWCCQFLDTPLSKIKVDHDELEKRRFAAGVATVGKQAGQGPSGPSRQVVRDKLRIPAQYFLDRGWSAGVLDKYDVGVPKEPRSEMVNRVVVPIYENTHRCVIGATGRSVFDRCEKCGLYHPSRSGCPISSEAFEFCKWRNSTGFSRESCLYNFWYAKDLIQKSGVAVIVEGPGDLWRLEESNIHIGVAMLGTSLSDQQQIQLEMSGALDLVILTNSDEAGQMSAKDLKRRLGRSFRLHFPKLETNDVGEMTTQQVRGLLMPLLQKI